MQVNSSDVLESTMRRRTSTNRQPQKIRCLGLAPEGIGIHVVWNLRDHQSGDGHHRLHQT